jgi:hypothetical protein
MEFARLANTIDDQPPAMPITPMATQQPNPGASAAAPVHNGPAHWILLTAQQDGTNHRDQYARWLQ